MKRFSVKDFILLGAALLLMTVAMLLQGMFLPSLQQWYVDSKLNEIQEKLWQKERKATLIQQEAVKYAPEKLFTEQEKLFEQSKKSNILLYVYEGGNLILWTDNRIFPVQTDYSQRSFIQHLNNGIYLQKNIRSHGLSFITLVPIKYLYPIENRYIHNKLALCSDPNLNLEVLLAPDEGAKDFFTKNGTYLFSLRPHASLLNITITGVLFTAGFLLLLVFMQRLLLNLLYKRKKNYFLFTLFAFLAFILFLWKGVKVQELLLVWKIFSPSYFAASYFLPSFGDLLLLTGFCGYLLWWLGKFAQRFKFSRWIRRTHIVLSLAVLFLLAGFIAFLCKSLVLDSQVSFDLSNIFSLDGFSFLGILILFFWLFYFYILASRVVKTIQSSFISFRLLTLLFLAGFSLGIGLMLLTGFFEMYALVFGIAGIIIFYYMPSGAYDQKILTRPVVFLLLISLFTSYLLTYYNKIKQDNNMIRLSEKIGMERDAVGEYLFSNIYNSLRNDVYLKNYFSSPIISEKLLSKRIRQLYFSGYFSKFDIDVRSFTTQGFPFKINSDRPLQYYFNLLKETATPVKGNYLFFLQNYSGLPTYISVVPISRNDTLIGTILIQLQQKAFYEESIYPELLLSEDLSTQEKMANYSFAIYNNKILLNQKGNYPYAGITEFQFKQDSATYFSYIENGYYHLIHQESQNLIVIVSRAAHSIIYYISFFSFLLLLFSICLSIVYFFTQVHFNLSKTYLLSLQKEKRWALWNVLSFRNKILFTILAGMTLSMIVIGFVTVYYIEKQYNRDEQDKLLKKTRFVTAEIETRLQDTDPDSENDEEVNSFIRNLSRVHQSDINVFDVNGNLLSTTQELMYENQLLAPKMDPLAYLKFYAQYASQVIQEEKVGTLKYTSSYMPLRNTIGNIIGFVNLPYFSKEQELDDRISSFLVALVNLYLFLFLALLVVGIFMARGLTVPLDIIRNHLRSMSLSGKNTLIAWNNKDEIGKLVQEYNTMIIALQENAARLAESEREVAWKEMAQQVAHEIKNPLTPMKLNIQRLQRAYHEGDPEVDSLFEKVTDMLINQIEGLTRIANEFSSLAKMPVGKAQETDLKKVLDEIAQLYSQSTNIEIRLIVSKDELNVLIDPEQLSRVFNNLVKNAIQAIPEGRKGLIEISAFLDKDIVKVKVRDNGIGVPENIQSNIFTPKFSTKNSGMGLGLAIVKSIIVNSGGTISFKSIQNEGTTFLIELPVIKRNL